MPQTPNHELHTPPYGAERWDIPLVENFEAIDTGLTIRADESDLGNYDPKSGAKFVATDTRAVYLGDGNSWDHFGYYLGPDGGSGNGDISAEIENHRQVDTHVQPQPPDTSTDLSEFSGSEGSSGQIPQTDGSNVSWVNPPEGTGGSGDLVAHDHSDSDSGGDTLRPSTMGGSITGNDDLSSFVGPNLSINTSGELESTASGAADVDGEDIEPRSIHQSATKAPIEGLVVESFDSGTLDHWAGGDIDHFSLVDSNDTYGPISGDYALQLDHPGGSESYAAHMGTNEVRCRRGEVYSCYVRIDELDNRNQSGLTVCGQWDGNGGVVQGYLARLEEDGQLNLLKWGYEGFEGGTSATLVNNLSEGTRYRIEIELDFDETIARLYDDSDAYLGAVEYGEGGSELLSDGGVGVGGRWANGSTGETVTWDNFTRKSLDSSPIRVSGEGTSNGGGGGGNGGDIDTTGYEEWDVLLTGDDSEGYHGVDNEGETVVDTSHAPTALNDAVDATPEGGTLVVNGYYPFQDGEEWWIEQDIRLLGHGATLETFFTDAEEGEFFIFMYGNQTGSYDVVGIDEGRNDTGNATKDTLILDQDVSGIMSAHDLVMVESDEEYAGYPGGPGTQEKGEGHMIAATSTEYNDADSGQDVINALSDNEIDLMEFLELDYDTSYNMQVVHFEPIAVHFEGFNLLGPDIWRPKVGGMEIRGVAECVFRDLHFEKIGYENLRVVASYDILADNCTFTYGASNYDGGDGYGIVAKGGCAHLYIENCTFHMMRHGIATAGSGYVGYNRREMVVDSCVFTFNRSTALDNHGEDLTLRVTNCRFTNGSDSGISFGGRHTIIEGNYFDMKFEDDACYDNGGQPNRTTVIANNIFRRATAGVDFQREDSYHQSVNIIGNSFHSCENAIECRSAIQMLSITGNTFADAEDRSIRFEPHSDWLDEPNNEHGVHSAHIADNTFVNDNGYSCIQWRHDSDFDNTVVAGDNITIVNNTARNVDHLCRTIGVARDCVVMGNHLIDADSLIEDGSSHPVTGWVVKDNILRDVSDMFSGQWDSSDHEVVDGGGWEL